VTDNRETHWGEAFYFSGNIHAKRAPEAKIKFIGNDHEAWFSTVGDTTTARLVLEHCIFEGAPVFRDAKYLYSFILKNSKISAPLSSYGRFGTRICGESGTIEHNILENASTIVANDSSGPLYIRHSLFYGVKGDLVMGISYQRCARTILKYNSFINLNPDENKVRYFKELDITENYWGTTDITIIDYCEPVVPSIWTKRYLKTRSSHPPYID